MTQLEDEIRSKNDAFQRLFAEDNIQELVDCVYMEDCKFMPHGTPTVEGRNGNDHLTKREL